MNIRTPIVKYVNNLKKKGRTTNNSHEKLKILIDASVSDRKYEHKDIVSLFRLEKRSFLEYIDDEETQGFHSRHC